MRRSGVCLSVLLLPLLGAQPASAQLCPALTPLTLSCGNGTCDLGESDTSCVADCLDRDTHAVGYYAQYSYCPESLIFRPHTVGELQMAVRELVAQNRRVKFMGSGHSTAGNFCSDGGVILTGELDGISEIETWNGHESVVVEAGVSFTQLTAHLAERGKWLGYTVVGYGPINVAGGVATGIHGSSTHGVAAISSRVLEIDLVLPDGTIAQKSAGNTTPDEWRALRANLGALGGMARVRLAVDDLTNLRAFSERLPITQPITSDDLTALTGGCDYAFLMLFPANDQWVRFCGQETSDPVTDPGAVNYLFSPSVTDLESDLFQTSAQLSACTPSLEPLFESVALDRMSQSPICLPDGAGGCTRVNDAVGPGHRMLTIDHFPANQPRFSQYDLEVSLRQSDAAAVLDFVNARFDQDGRGMPLVGAVVRFDEARDDTLLGANSLRPGAAAGERLVHIELPFYAPYGFTETQLAAYSQPYYDVLEWVLASFPSAQLHFGKNTPRLFADAAHRANVASRMARFQAVVNAWDPYGIYANDYLRNLGLSWPREGQPFAPVYIRGDVRTSAYTQTARLFALRSQSSGRCLTSIGEPGLFLDGTVFGIHPGETRDCARALSDGDPRQRFFVRDVATGKLVDTLVPNRIYSIHPEDDPYVQCLDSLWGLDYRFAACNGSSAQRFKLELDGSGTGRIVAQNNPSFGCMDDLAGSDAVSIGFCSPWSDPSELRWQFLPLETRTMPRQAGVGGDPYWIDRLAIEGLDLDTVNAQGLPQLAARLGDDQYLVYRQRIIDNANGNPAPGFRVCARAPSGELLRGADGRELACAYTDANGDFTLLGLRRNADVITTIERKGYLQNAIVFSTTYEGWFEQEYSGVAALAQAGLGLSVDSRFPYTSGFGLRSGYGDLSLTVLDETDPVGSRGYGTTEAGDYAGNGIAGATFRLYRDDGSGAFAIPYPDLVGNQPGDSTPDGIPDGLKYLAQSTNILLGGSEVPTNDRTSTVAPYGGAIAFSVPDGLYEAEVLHPTRSCYPGLDAWPGSLPQRARLRVIAGHMSDVRFFCD